MRDGRSQNTDRLQPFSLPQDLCVPQALFCFPVQLVQFSCLFFVYQISSVDELEQNKQE